MCEANAYTVENGREKLLTETVYKLVPDGGMRMRRNVFGQKTFIQSRIKKLDLAEPKLILDNRM
ncbi:MAG: CooT family nickel-binding protein [Firmicutes bacterium]|nr:CooT family nickel-binding protein [Bacillota bacterium]